MNDGKIIRSLSRAFSPSIFSGPRADRRRLDINPNLPILFDGEKRRFSPILQRVIGPWGCLVDSADFLGIRTDPFSTAHGACSPLVGVHQCSYRKPATDSEKGFAGFIHALSDRLISPGVGIRAFARAYILYGADRFRQGLSGINMGLGYALSSPDIFCYFGTFAWNGSRQAG